jgi:hypothetical protein
VRPGQIGKSLKAFNLSEQDETDRAWHRLQQLNSVVDEIKQRLATEKLPANYREELKQRLEKLDKDRVKELLGRS